jgi:hypothetical protein
MALLKPGSHGLVISARFTYATENGGSGLKFGLGLVDRAGSTRLASGAAGGAARVPGTAIAVTVSSATSSASVVRVMRKPSVL